MRPVSPIVPGLDLPVTNFAETQDEYNTLPAYKQQDGTVLTRRRLTWKERLHIFVRGDLHLFTLTFNRPLQPVNLQVERPAEGRLKFYCQAFLGYYHPTRKTGRGVAFSVFNGLRLAARIGK